jgi:hypothetical protein
MVAKVSLHFLSCLTTGDSLSVSLVNIHNLASDSTEVCLLEA